MLKSTISQNYTKGYMVYLNCAGHAPCQIYQAAQRQKMTGKFKMFFKQIKGYQHGRDLQDVTQGYDKVNVYQHVAVFFWHFLAL